MRTSLRRVVIGLLALLCVCTVVQRSRGLAQPNTAGNVFQRYDRNGDGKVTREELPASRIVEGSDVNQDGVVTREEVADFFRKQQTGALTTPTTPLQSLTPPDPRPPAAPNVEIAETLNVPYATIEGVAPNLLSLDIHAPEAATGMPVVIYVHGGYWKAGDKAHKAHFPAFFCGRGFVFISVNYQLAPAVRHPTQVQDVARSVAWVHDHIADYGGDPSQIYLTGHSAGPQLVALLSTDAKRLEELGKPISILRAVIAFDSAAMDIRSVAANDRRPDSPYRAAFGDDPAAWADASPIVHAERAKGLPPFQIVVAYGPAIANKKAGVDTFAAALRNNGTRAEVVDVSSFREHQSLMTEFGREGDPVSAAVLGFIESVRSGQPVAGLGGERVLEAEGRAAEDAARQLEAYRTRTVMMQFDKNRDGRISRAEMSANPFLFARLDADQDGSVTSEELSVADEREQPLKKGRPPADPKPTTPSANAGTPADQSVGSAGVSYRDPEFLQSGGLVTFADQNGDVWVGEMDLHTGRFANTRHRRDHRLDGPVSKWSGYCNGPEWGLDAGGPAVFYIKDNSQGTGQLWRAAPPWDRPHLTQLTHDTNIHNWICEPSATAKLPTTRVIIYHGGGPDGGNVDAWLDDDAPEQLRIFTDRAYLARFSHNTPFITWSPRRLAGDRATTQVSLLDTTTGTVRVITDDDGAKYDPWLWHAPEFAGELLLCVNLDERALAIYRDLVKDGATPWTRITEIRLPADAPSPQLKSCEPVNGGRGMFGRSWFAAQAGDDQDPDTSIWLLGFDPQGNHAASRLDEGLLTKASARRLDPETLIGERELFVYYTLAGSSGSQLRLCRTGVTKELTQP